MFGSQNKKRKNKAAAHTLISAVTQIQGDVRFDGELIIEGQVTGNISAADDSDAILRVAGPGMVDGEVRVPNIVINGTVKGDIHACKHVELAANSVINGDVYYQLIEMVMGAQVNGSLLCQLKPEEPHKALTHQPSAPSEQRESLCPESSGQSD